MESRFSAKEYVKTLAQELVESFDKAGRATTPGLVGSAREKAVRRKLEEIFPQAIGVGTGCVIDVHNKTSKQTDIIIYEKDICPVFAINDNPESSYYTCESVIAVGEVKSTLGTAEFGCLCENRVSKVFMAGCVVDTDVSEILFENACDFK